MRFVNYGGRCFKELIRDPLSIIFAILLPMFLLFIFQQFNIPNEAYLIENFTPGIIVFGFSFISMFVATLVAKDRSTSLLSRLAISPMKPHDFVLGYILATFPVVLIQIVLFFALAVILGLKLSLGLILSIFVIILISLLFTSLGILIGSFSTENGAAGVSSVIVQLVCFTSGMYFPKEMLGKFFGTVCEYLPFESCVTVIKAVMNNDAIEIRNIAVLLIYFAVIFISGIWLFNKKIHGEK